MTQEKPDDIEDISDGDLEEIKKKPEYKDASTPDELWKSWLERRKYGATCLLYTSPSPRDRTRSRMPSSA